MWEMTKKTIGGPYEAHNDFYLFSIYSVPSISHISSNIWKNSIRLRKEVQETDSNLGLSGFHTCALPSSSLYPQRCPAKGSNPRSFILCFHLMEISFSFLFSFSPFQSVVLLFSNQPSFHVCSPLRNPFHPFHSLLHWTFGKYRHQQTEFLHPRLLWKQTRVLCEG